MTKESIKVFIRIRPFLPREANSANVIKTNVDGSDVNSLSIESDTKNIRCSYDKVFNSISSQEEIYDNIKDTIEDVTRGINATLFAYGQTGSGKSFTMFGNENDDITKLKAASAGIIPRAIQDLFMKNNSKDSSIYCSFMQIYNENIYDLLRDSKMQNPLPLREDSSGAIMIENLSEYDVKSVSDCLKLLSCGEESRAIRSTKMNNVSSRSHSVFQLVVTKTDKESNTSTVSKLNLVDLAGSEKWMNASDVDHISEMNNINLSLHTLGRCVAALAAGSTSHHHVPYRESKLTRLLQDSLGGNTSTRIIATLSPSRDCIDESISTLKFADRAAQVMVTTPIANVTRTDIDLQTVLRLEGEVARLKGLLKAFGSSGESDETAADSSDNNNNRLGKLQALVLSLSNENQALREQQNNSSHQSPETLTSPEDKGSSSVSGEQNSVLKADFESTCEIVAQMKELTDKFFSFDVEEDDLKSGIDVLNKRFQRIRSKNSGGGTAKSNNASFLPSIGPATPKLKFRIRGKNNTSSSDWTSTNSNTSAKNAQKELLNAKKAMAKQAKLQAWLIEKEKRELQKITQEQEYVAEQKRIMSERDAKFFKRINKK